jgi:hypothetical protein
VGLFGRISRTAMVERHRWNPRPFRATILFPHKPGVVFRGDPRVTSLCPHRGTLPSLSVFRLSVGDSSTVLIVHLPVLRLPCTLTLSHPCHNRTHGFHGDFLGYRDGARVTEGQSLDHRTSLRGSQESGNNVKRVV